MATVAAPYVQTWSLAGAAFAEGCECLSDAAGMSKDEARPSVAYSYQVLTSGLIQVEALARKYIASVECTSGGAARPILDDPAFGAAALNCAKALEETVPHLGVPGQRIADAVRRWVNNRNPAEANTLAMSCDACARMTKMKAARAA